MESLANARVFAHAWAPRRAWLPGPRVLPTLATFVLFVALFAAGSLRYEGFFAGQVLLNLLVDNAFLIVLAVVILAQDGAEGITFGTLDPANLFNPGMFAILGVGFAAFMGFESTALYREEARRNAATLNRYGIDGQRTLQLAMASIGADGQIACRQGKE